jgi:hypothetical protein
MPRNAEVMFLYDRLERLILNIGALKDEVGTQAATVLKNVEALAKAHRGSAGLKRPISGITYVFAVQANCSLAEAVIDRAAVEAWDWALQTQPVSSSSWRRHRQTIA